MSPELRKRMEEAAIVSCQKIEPALTRDMVSRGHSRMAANVGFKEGAEWMHTEEVVPRDEKNKAVVEYCLLYSDMMWAATVISKLLDCDFRDSERVAKMYLKQFGKGGEG